jgi:hypothetical protein
VMAAYFPSGEKATPNGRVGVAGLLVPTNRGATSASLAPATALSTMMMETVLPYARKPGSNDSAVSPQGDVGF